MRLSLPQELVKGAAAVTELYEKATNQAVMLTRDKCNERHAPCWVRDGSEARKVLSWQATPQTRFARKASACPTQGRGALRPRIRGPAKAPVGQPVLPTRMRRVTMIRRGISYRDLGKQPL